MFIVEVVEEIKVLSEDCICDDYHRGLILIDKDVTECKSRKVVGIFRDRDRAEECRRLQHEFVEGRQGWEPQVIIREIDSDF